MQVSGAIIAGFIGALLPLAFFGQGEGVWWIKILAIAAAPFIFLAAATGFVFASAIRRHPWAWGATAVLVAIIAATGGLWIATHTLIGIVGLPIAVIALVIFRIILGLMPADDPIP